jgi:hypothetical protein
MDELTRRSWFCISAHGSGAGRPQQHRLSTLHLAPRNVGEIFLGPPDPLLSEARRWARAAGRPPAGVVIDGRVVSDTSALLWHGDLDLLDRANAVQQAADLLAQPVHLTDESHRWPCTHDDSLRWCEASPLRTFLPATSVSHPWARLHFVKHPPLSPPWRRWQWGDAAVEWYPSETTKRMNCVMRFGPEHTGLDDTSVAAVDELHPGLGGATQALVEEVLDHLDHERLDLGPGIDLTDTIERYITCAVAQLAEIPTVIDAWRHTRTEPTMPDHRTYGCRCFRRGGSRATR